MPPTDLILQSICIISPAHTHTAPCLFQVRDIGLQSTSLTLVIAINIAMVSQVSRLLLQLLRQCQESRRVACLRLLKSHQQSRTLGRRINWRCSCTTRATATATSTTCCTTTTTLLPRTAHG